MKFARALGGTGSLGWTIPHNNLSTPPLAFPLSIMVTPPFATKLPVDVGKWSSPLATCSLGLDRQAIILHHSH